MRKIFDDISSSNKDRILLSLEANTSFFKKNNTILSSVKRNNIIGIILEGHIQIIKTDYNGNRTIIEDMYEDDVFGSNLSSISNSEYSVITKEDSKIIIIYFDDIINNELNTGYYNQFLKNLLSIISDKMKSNNDRTFILANKSIRDKLLAYFKVMSDKNKSKVIYLPYTYTDLADYLNVDRSAMYRELKNLKEEGIIEVKNKKITLNFFENDLDYDLII